MLQVQIATLLVEEAKIPQQSIGILSPYNAQVADIRELLKTQHMNEITVTTITKSQGDGKTVQYMSSTTDLLQDVFAVQYTGMLMK